MGVLLMVVFGVQLEVLAHIVLSPVMEHENLKLLVVMIATPMTMNALQFWLVDNFIKKKDAPVSPRERQMMERSNELGTVPVMMLREYLLLRRSSLHATLAIFNNLPCRHPL